MKTKIKTIYAQYTKNVLVKKLNRLLSFLVGQKYIIICIKNVLEICANMTGQYFVVQSVDKGIFLNQIMMNRSIVYEIIVSKGF